MHTKDIPDIIKEVGFDFSWDEKKVWALKYPVEKMDIEQLTWHFTIPFHWHDGGVYNLSSAEILAHPEQYPEEYARTMHADLRFPIDIMWNKGRWLILDGLHRLMKAKVLGMKTVSVRKIPRSAIPKILQ